MPVVVKSGGRSAPGEVVILLRRSQDDRWLEVGRADGTTGWVAAAELIRAGLARVPRPGDEQKPVNAQAPAGDSPVAPAVPALLPSVRTDGSGWIAPAFVTVAEGGE